MSDIPSAKKLLKEIIRDVRNPQIALRLVVVLTMMTRKRHKPVIAPVQSTPISPALLRRLYEFSLAHPDWTNEQVGERFGVSGGRVSEAYEKVSKWQEDQ